MDPWEFSGVACVIRAMQTSTASTPPVATPEIKKMLATDVPIKPNAVIEKKEASAIGEPEPPLGVLSIVNREKEEATLRFRMSLLGELAGISYELLPLIVRNFPPERWNAIGSDILQLNGMRSAPQAAPYIWNVYKRVCKQDVHFFVARASNSQSRADMRDEMIALKLA